MHGTLNTTLKDLGFQSSLDVEIEYNITPGEKTVMYDKDGGGYPGSPPVPELEAVRVTLWYIGHTFQSGYQDWAWKALDDLALAIVEKDWTYYGDLCLEDAANTIYEEKNQC